MNAEIEAKRMDIFHEIVARAVSNGRSADAAAKDASAALKAFDSLFRPKHDDGNSGEVFCDSVWANRILAETYFTAAEGAIGALNTHGSYQGTGAIHHDAFGNMVICALLVEFGNGVKRVVLGHVFAEPGVERNAAKENALRYAHELGGWVF